MWVRVREVLDWRFLLAAAFLTLVVTASLNSWATEQHNRVLVEQIKQDRADAVVERAQASRERRRLLDGQEQLRERHERLLDYLRSIGIEVPESVYRTSRVDDDDGADTNITVRPETSSNESGSRSSSSPSPNPSASTPDNNVTDVVPQVPLPEPAGEATDTAKRIIEDVTGIVPEQ